LREKHSLQMLFWLMQVNPSGYYKWRAKRGLKNHYEQDRELLSGFLIAAHQKHKSYGYHRLATVVRKETGWLFSDNLAHKCCKWNRIRSKAKHYKYRNTGGEHVLYPNLVRNNWKVSRPMELVSSDMTMLRFKGKKYEWTYMIDVYNNEILTHHSTDNPGNRSPYFECLRDLVSGIKEQTAPIILHTDQGAVYSSRAFAKAHEHCNIIRSMSRVGTPTDNPVIEAINGWIKEELRLDFPTSESENIHEYLNKYVKYFNEERPAYKLKYQSPIQYRTERGFG
jgi:putative transposase